MNKIEKRMKTILMSNAKKKILNFLPFRFQKELKIEFLFNANPIRKSISPFINNNNGDNRQFQEYH